MRVAIVGAGLAGLAAAVDLVDAGHQVDLYEARPFMGGKVQLDDGESIEMVACLLQHANLFALSKVGAIDNVSRITPTSSATRAVICASSIDSPRPSTASRRSSPPQLT